MLLRRIQNIVIYRHTGHLCTVVTLDIEFKGLTNEVLELMAAENEMEFFKAGRGKRN